MADSKKIELVGRYLNDQMGPDERARFQGRLGTDPELRKLMDAEELIRRTIRRDLEAVPAGHAATRMRVMDMLAKAPPPAAIAPGGLAGAMGLVKMIMISIAGLGVMTAVYFFYPRQNAPQERPAAPVVSAPAAPATVPAAAPAPVADQNAAPVSEPSQAAPAEIRTPEAAPAEASTTEPARVAPSRSAPSTHASAAARRAEEPAAPATSHTTVASSPAATTPPPAPPIRIIRKDKDPFSVEIGVPPKGH